MSTKLTKRQWRNAYSDKIATGNYRSCCIVPGCFHHTSARNPDEAQRHLRIGHQDEYIRNWRGSRFPYELVACRTRAEIERLQNVYASVNATNAMPIDLSTHTPFLPDLGLTSGDPSLHTSNDRSFSTLGALTFPSSVNHSFPTPSNDKDDLWWLDPALRPTPLPRTALAPVRFPRANQITAQGMSRDQLLTMAGNGELLYPCPKLGSC